MLAKIEVEAEWEVIQRIVGYLNREVKEPFDLAVETDLKEKRSMKL